MLFKNRNNKKTKLSSIYKKITNYMKKLKL